MMKYRIALVALAAAVALSACARTKQVEVSGETKFLTPETAAMLEPNEDKFTLEQRYVAPPETPARYNKVLVDPIMFMTTPDEKGEVSAENKQRMANAFHQLLAQELGNDYDVVTEPQANTIRVQVAVIKATQKNVTLDTVSTVMPAGLALSLTAQQFTGEPAFIGQLAIEAKMTDSQTGELLGAGRDARAGGKEWTKDQFDSWGNVLAAMGFYAKLARYRFCTESGRTECIEPAVQYQ